MHTRNSNDTDLVTSVTNLEYQEELQQTYNRFNDIIDEYFDNKRVSGFHQENSSLAVKPLNDDYKLVLEEDDLLKLLEDVGSMTIDDSYVSKCRNTGNNQEDDVLELPNSNDSDDDDDNPAATDHHISSSSSSYKDSQGMYMKLVNDFKELKVNLKLRIGNKLCMLKKNAGLFHLYNKINDKNHQIQQLNLEVASMKKMISTYSTSDNINTITHDIQSKYELLKQVEINALINTIDKQTKSINMSKQALSDINAACDGNKMKLSILLYQLEQEERKLKEISSSCSSGSSSSSTTKTSEISKLSKPAEASVAVYSPDILTTDLIEFTRIFTDISFKLQEKDCDLEEALIKLKEQQLTNNELKVASLTQRDNIFNKNKELQRIHLSEEAKFVKRLKNSCAIIEEKLLVEEVNIKRMEEMITNAINTNSNSKKSDFVLDSIDGKDLYDKLIYNKNKMYQKTQKNNQENKKSQTSQTRKTEYKRTLQPQQYKIADGIIDVITDSIYSTKYGLFKNTTTTASASSNSIGSFNDTTNSHVDRLNEKMNTRCMLSSINVDDAIGTGNDASYYAIINNYCHSSDYDDYGCIEIVKQLDALISVIGAPTNDYSNLSQLKHDIEHMTKQITKSFAHIKNLYRLINASNDTYYKCIKKKDKVRQQFLNIINHGDRAHVKKDIAICIDTIDTCKRNISDTQAVIDKKKERIKQMITIVNNSSGSKQKEATIVEEAEAVTPVAVHGTTTGVTASAAATTTTANATTSEMVSIDDIDEGSDVEEPFVDKGNHDSGKAIRRARRSTILDVHKISGNINSSSVNRSILRNTLIDLDYNILDNRSYKYHKHTRKNRYCLIDDSDDDSDAGTNDSNNITATADTRLHVCTLDANNLIDSKVTTDAANASSHAFKGFKLVPWRFTNDLVTATTTVTTTDTDNYNFLVTYPLC